MRILGIHDGHNSTACIMEDGMISACASEERFTRQKNEMGYPTNAIDFCLKQTNLTPEDIDVVAMGSRDEDTPTATAWVTIRRESTFKIKDFIREQYDYFKPLLIDKENPDVVLRRYMKSFRVTDIHLSYTKMRLSRIMAHLKIDEKKIKFLDHHTCHSYYAYYGSPFRNEKVLVLTADGWGDGANATVSVAENNKIKEIFRTPNCQLARMYRYATLLLGMRPFEHEYKVMGLAPYATEYQYKAPYEIYKNTLYVDGLDFKYKEKPSDLYFWFKDKFEGYRFDGIAGAVQKYMEDMMTTWVKNAIKKTGINKIVFSGGLAMNIKANGAIAKLPEVNDMFVCASGGDESCAIGAAYYTMDKYCEEHNLDKKIIKPLKNTYFGPEFRDEEVRQEFKKWKIEKKYDLQEDISYKEVVDLLLKGRVIGRCAGRMEFGARALGNRTIMADPRDYKIVEVINNQIKFRDFWMPFTPTMLSERTKDYLINPKGIWSPHMTVGFDAKEISSKHLPAAMHPADKTIRPQMLTEEINPDYYKLIKYFEKMTGVGAILNTSLNIHGEPIVCSPKDAIHTMENSGLDGMYFGNVLILRK